MDFDLILEELEDNSTKLRVGYARDGERLMKAVECGEHEGIVIHEWPTFRPWKRLTFWCDRCGTKHMVERWQVEGEWRLQLWR